MARPDSVVAAPDRLAAAPAPLWIVAPFGRLTPAIASAATLASPAPTV